MAFPRSLDVLGPLYLQDPTLAPELTAALRRHAGDPELIVNQAWLDCHWHHPEAFEMLVEIARDHPDLDDREPQPITRFMKYCWHHKLQDWHHFIRLAHLDSEPFAHMIYAQFAHEGPTDDVLESLCFLSNSTESDRFADVVHGMMLAALSRECHGAQARALRLWRRYPLPREYVTAEMVLKFRQLLKDPLVQHRALRIFEHFTFRVAKQMLDEIAEVAVHGLTLEAEDRARAIITGLSYGRGACHVARAVVQHGWHDYLTGLHHQVQFLILDFLQTHRRFDMLLALYDIAAHVSVARGVFTRIMEMRPTALERMCIGTGGDLCGGSPMNMHAAVHYMYFKGQVPPFKVYFYQALQAHPDAVATIAERAPAVRVEVRWARIKLLACCLMLGGTAPVAKRPKVSCAMAKLAEYQEAWTIVLGYL